MFTKAFAFVLLLCAPGFAQSWSEVTALAPGTHVKILDRIGTSAKGF